jgi:hypothetical protein
MEQHRRKVCEAIRNVVGTPGLANHVYHRMVDHSMEAGFEVGLAWGVNEPKPAWSTWATADRLSSLACGFEDLPYTRLRQGERSGGLLDLGKVYWTSSRILPPGFSTDAAGDYRLLREWEPGTRLLFECARDGETTMITADPTCAGMVPMGPVGWAWMESRPDSVPLYRCALVDIFSDTHFVSTDANCEGEANEALLGYVLPASG